MQEASSDTVPGAGGYRLSFDALDIAVTDHKMTPGPIPPGCAPPVRRYDFAPSEVIAYQWTAASGARAGDLVRWDWIRPDGIPFRSDQLTFSVSGDVCFSAGLFILGQSPATMPGAWKVNVFYNGTRVLIENFTIGENGPRLCGGALEGFFEGAVRLGTSVAVATCFGTQTLDAAAVSRIADDLIIAARGLEQGSPCIPFDASRLADLRGRLSGMTGEAAARELNQIIQGVTQAVRRAGFRSELVGPGGFEGMARAAVGIGMTIGNAACFPCEVPVPEPAVPGINSALSDAEAALRLYASCIPGFDFTMFVNRRVGAPATAQQTVADLHALSAALVSAICHSDCCFTCPGGPPVGAVQGTVRNATNNQPIQGASVSVSGLSLTTTSGADGAYSFGEVPAGQQTLNASAVGFIPGQVTVTVTDNQTVTKDILLLPVPITGMVQGTVRNASDNQPISGATIAVVNTSLSTSSGSGGAYTLINVPVGQRNLNASAPGFMSSQIMTTVLANQAVTVDFLLSPVQTGTVQGTVRNASNGQPITGATVSLAGTGLSTASGADGVYTLSNAPVGQQTLNASASGFIPTQVTITVSAGQTVTQNISLSPILAGGEVRITLNWTKDSNGGPDDLDMHLGGPNPDGFSCFEVSFLNLGSLTSPPFAMLEVDNIEINGHPPTETIRIARRTPGIYRFFVDNFGAERLDGISRSVATVQVFGDSGLLFSATAPAGSGFIWNVFTLNGETGVITPVNQYSFLPPPLEPCH